MTEQIAEIAASDITARVDGHEGPTAGLFARHGDCGRAGSQ